MSASNALENAILDHILGGPDYERLGTVYIALHTSDPGEAGTGSTNEASGTNYARVAVTNNDTNFPAASSGSKSNAVAIEFPTPGSGGWGTVTHVSVTAASSGASAILFSAALAVAKTINQDDTVSFGIGDLVFTAD